MTGPQEGDLLRPVPADIRQHSRIGLYLHWLERTKGLHFDGYDPLWQWSVTDLEGFWGSIAEFFEVRFHDRPAAVLGEPKLPGTQWFPGSTLNYAEHCLGRLDDPAGDADDLAVIAVSQTRPRLDLTVGELRDQVARAAAGLRRLGVGRGDRVVAYLPNIPETLVAFLATASLGAVWASCAPEFGPRSVVDRFAQVEPKVLLAVSGYVYGDKPVDRRAESAEVFAGLPTAEHLVEVPYGERRLDGALPWADLLAEPAAPEFTAVPFDHPLYVLFSSGTTGKPKAIVHGHGGILVEHLKSMSLHWDLGPGERLLWFTTTAWMMWNALVSARLVGGVPVMIDGNPLHPDLTAQWALVEQTGATLVGLSPGYVMACRKAGLEPGAAFDLSSVRQVGVAGSPLPVEGSAWLAEQFRRADGTGPLINVGSGGTDVCTGIVQAAPNTPVWAGEMSAASLGVHALAYDAQNRPVVGELGELVIVAPMPSMPVGFWGDEDGSRYRATYFDDIPGVWRHGDWIRFTERGSSVITGRSDATLNRGGVRLGTADFYGVVEEFPELTDSLVVHLEDADGGPGELVLFVVPAAGVVVDDALTARIVRSLRTELSPRHIPDSVVSVPAVPRSRTGKKLELPVKRILQGTDPETVASTDALVDPESLIPFIAEAHRRADAR